MAQLTAIPAHNTFPLTRQALDNLSLTPEFEYPDPYNARVLNNRLRPPLPVYTPGEISAVGLIGKIYLRVIDLYISTTSPDSLHLLDQKLSSVSAPDRLDNMIELILGHFPTTPSYYSASTSLEYLISYSGSPDRRHGAYKSFLLIFLADSNPALLKKDNLFTDPELRGSQQYVEFRSYLFDHFADQPSFDSGGQSILDFLIEPSRLHPDSLYDQLEYIRQNWSAALGDDFLNALLTVLDRIKEEKSRYPSDKPSPQDPLRYSFASYLTEEDAVRFSADLDWMPNVILMAKNIFVWLDQLSKEYQTSIYQLNHIPDQELAKLSSWGVTGLWLIGLWQRSSASQKIKQICGNLDAVPSAYSLYDYSIAETLGGDEAYQDLSNRAAKYNIRLAADMVPNHMGIYSKWVVEHPDWFLSVDKSPFPAYSFQGTNLSEDERVSIHIEDHYYDKTDAAVVFKRYDQHTGTEKYIYHGNDGTAMPWNDTAQLDFLNPEVREAVIQKILFVAKKFPIIRFDAAMTLTKKHIQRLWFPEPGSGGAIPTRSDFSLSKEEFDKAIPEEFWREVVDRVASEAPQTLLLAEAFWMMEGYFVRSLWMHRVYNSAFMHMLRDEENGKYRDLIIKTLEYDPQILKRYVNFMNNPDEETAIAQYGADGKYFGVCVLMATLPGLPMLGHGQVEGYSEKYGMEYRRAYYNEEPNQGLIERHQEEIFPLLHKRYLFAEVDNFYLFDFQDDYGNVNEEIFALTNRTGKESALVVYHNKWGDTSGSIQNSVSIQGNSTRLIESLGLTNLDGDYVLFRDQISGFEYIRTLSDFSSNGIRLDLGAYEYHVFMDFHVVTDQDGSYAQLFECLNMHGAYSLDEILIELKLAPLAKNIALTYSAVASLLEKKEPLFSELKVEISPMLDDLESILTEMISPSHPLPSSYRASALKRLNNFIENFSPVFPNSSHPFRAAVTIWSLIDDLYSQPLQPAIGHLSKALLNQPYFQKAFNDVDNFEFSDYYHSISRLSPLLSDIDLNIENLIQLWFSHDTHGNFLGLNEHNDITWFNKEIFEHILDLTVSYLLFTDSSVELFTIGEDYHSQLIHFRSEILDCMEKSNYQHDKFYKSLLRFGKEWNSPKNKSRS